MSNDAYIDDLLAALDTVRQERDAAVAALDILAKVIDERDTLRAALQAMTKQRNEYRTLSGIGQWHNDCRPNREQAARELDKSQAVINKLADEITSLRAALQTAEGREQRLAAIIEELRVA